MTRRSNAGRGALEDLQVARRGLPATFSTAIDELESIRSRMQQLRLDHNNPERFFAERSDIAGQLGGVIKRMREAPPHSTTAALAASAYSGGPPPPRQLYPPPGGRRPILKLKQP